MTLKDALAICHPFHDFGRLTSPDAAFHGAAPTPADNSGTTLCPSCDEPFDGDQKFEVCHACEDYAASGERDADIGEEDRDR